LPSHIGRAFADDAREAAKQRPSQAAAGRWDARKLHAHLTLSATGRTAATTGCACYGCVLAARPATMAASGDTARYWEVEVVSLDAFC
jgi:hypothetical protein